MALPVSFNPCENINSEIDREIHELEQKGVELRSQIAKLRNEIMSFAGTPSEVHDIEGAIAAVTVGDFDAGSTAITQITNFSGDCLTSVFNGARRFAAELEAWNNDMIDEIGAFIALPEGDLLQVYREYSQALGAAQVTSLLAAIDEKLGCLAGQGSEIAECLSIIDNFNDRIEDLLKYMGLSASGTLDLTSFADQFKINIDKMSDLFDNVTRLDEHLETLNTQIQTSVDAAIVEYNKTLSTALSEWI